MITVNVSSILAKKEIAIIPPATQIAEKRLIYRPIRLYV